MPFKPLVDFKSIEDEFSGVFQTVHPRLLKSALSELKLFKSDRIKSLRARFLMLESAGPNGKVSMWQSTVDAFAFARHPAILLAYIK